MKLSNKSFNKILTIICNEDAEFAQDFAEVEEKIPNKLKRKIEECKFFDYEDKNSIAVMTTTRKLKLWIKFKDTDRDFILILEPTSKQAIVDGKRLVAEMSYNEGYRYKVYNISMYFNDEELNLETDVSFESSETGEQSAETTIRVKPISNDNGLLV